MKVIEFNRSNITPELDFDLINFCKQAELESSAPALDNVIYTEWENKPESLLHVLFKTDRFDAGKGNFYMLYNDDDYPIAVSGVYKSDFDPNVAIGGVRTWKLSQNRGHHIVAEYILPLQVAWAKNNGCKVFALSFNDYNSKLMQILNRSGKYEKTRSSKFLFGKQRTLFYQEMQMLPFKVLIKNTEQHILYKTLDSSYSVNWPKVS